VWKLEAGSWKLVTFIHMARGFESKMVEFQQEEAARKRASSTGGALTPEQQADAARRRGLELARARAAADLERATAPAHRRMLEQAIKALDEQLNTLGPGATG
jgi:hypothetical protein